MSSRTCRYTRTSPRVTEAFTSHLRVSVSVSVRVRVRVRVRVTKKERYIRAFSSTSPPGTTALAERRILRRDACARAARPTRQGVIGGHHAQLDLFCRRDTTCKAGSHARISFAFQIHGCACPAPLDTSNVPVGLPQLPVGTTVVALMHFSRSHSEVRGWLSDRPFTAQQQSMGRGLRQTLIRVVRGTWWWRPPRSHLVFSAGSGGAQG